MNGYSNDATYKISLLLNNDEYLYQRIKFASDEDKMSRLVAEALHLYPGEEIKLHEVDIDELLIDAGFVPEE